MAKEAKPVGEMTVKECLAELKKLEKDVEFDVKFNTKTPVAELRALVAEGRDALAGNAKDADLGGEGEEGSEEAGTDAADDATDEPAEEANAETGEDAEESEESEEETPTIRTPNLKEPLSMVVLRDGTRRTYCQSIQGKNWKILATQYHAHHKGSKLVER